MKIRSGFVSNSSSASFVITPKEDVLLMRAKRALEANGENVDCHFITAKDVAIAMLGSLMINYESSDEDKEYYKRLGKMMEKLHAADPDVEFVFFPSCNYDTEILEVADGKIIISTCNNEDPSWNVAMEAIQEKFEVNVEATGEDRNDPDFENNLYYTDWEDRKKNGNGEYTFSHFDPEKIKKSKKHVFLSKPKVYRD